MIARVSCTENAARALREFCALPGKAGECGGEIEFRELPYFLVERSAHRWTEGQGDVNVVRVLAANDRGLVIDPLSETMEAGKVAGRHTLVPWTNVVSLTIERS